MSTSKLDIKQLRLEYIEILNLVQFIIFFAPLILAMCVGIVALIEMCMECLFPVKYKDSVEEYNEKLGKSVKRSYFGTFKQDVSEMWYLYMRYN
jgi:hypothetical protein